MEGMILKILYHGADAMSSYQVINYIYQHTVVPSVHTNNLFRDIMNDASNNF